MKRPYRPRCAYIRGNYDVADGMADWYQDEEINNKQKSPNGENSPVSSFIFY